MREGARVKGFRAEQILEVPCPKCGAGAHQFCNRRRDKLSRQGKALAAAGTPPSHQERMWLRQGHSEEEFPALRAGIQPGDYPARGVNGGQGSLFDRTIPKPGTARASGYGL